MESLSQSRVVEVFGPAYLDRVARVDDVLVDRAVSKALDASVEGVWESVEGETLALVDLLGATIVLSLPDDWPGPRGLVRLKSPLTPGVGLWRTEVRVTSWRDDLGGMGSGFAKAFSGHLTCALGSENDPNSRVVAELLRRNGISYRPLRVLEKVADWTLLVSSGAHGDKLPIGFRGCHSALMKKDINIPPPCDLFVVCAVPNALAEETLPRVSASCRMFAPALRNMVDRAVSVARFADLIDVLSCNRREWETLPDREEVLEKVAIVAVTDGPRGATVWFQERDGTRGESIVSAFPRSRPPRDTNRAGEAFASTLVSTLLDLGWTRGPVAREIIDHASRRASAASALVLDRLSFGFADAAEIDRAVADGIVR